MHCLPARRRPAHRVATCGLLVVVLSACGSGPAPGPTAPPVPPTPPVIENATGRPLAVSDERSGARVVLAPAQELLVSLALSTVNGPEWSLVDLPAGVLAVRATTFERALRNTTDDEGAGASIWRFSAASSGHVTLRFELRRPRSVEPAIRSVSFDVTVR